jgi:hypothetical protein
MNLLLDNPQFWAILVGSIVPLGGYVINRMAPWVDESVKATVTVVLAAIATGLYTALDTSVFGFNEPTFQLVFSGIFAALMAHKILWKPARINEKLGAIEDVPEGK